MAKTAAALHILVKEEKLALDLLEQIKNGGDFEKLAKKHSICPSGKKGGHLGEFRQGQMVPAFDKVVFSCPVLEPTGPLHTQFGYHIIKVRAKSPAGVVPYEQMRAFLLKYLQDEEAKKLLEVHVQELRKKAQIEVVTE